MLKQFRRVLLTMLTICVLLAETAAPALAGENLNMYGTVSQPAEAAIDTGLCGAEAAEAAEVPLAECHEEDAPALQEADIPWDRENDDIVPEIPEDDAAITAEQSTEPDVLIEAADVPAGSVYAEVTEQEEREPENTEPQEREPEGREQEDAESEERGTEAVEPENEVPAEEYAADDELLSYADDEERFGRYYDSLCEVEVPEAPANEADLCGEELVGAGIPSSYIAGRLTPVRDQGTSDLCWAFSATALLETSLLKKYPGLDAKTLDLSEEQLVYFYFNRQNDPLGNTGDMRMVSSSAQWDAYRYSSGSTIYLLQELSTGQGVARESDVPFYMQRRMKADGSVYYEESTRVPDKSAAYLSYANITGYETFDYSVDKVKKEIMDNGAVSVAMYYDNADRNLKTNGYYNPYHMRSNHVVTLVGWDDAYAVSKFNGSPMSPKRSGAWIAKNSWGDDWGDNGYFYISYENATMIGCLSAEAVLTSEKTYRNLYFYDGLAMVGNSCCIDPLASAEPENITAAANIYEVKAGSGKGEAIGEITLCTWTQNAVYRVSVYTDLLDTSDPTAGRRAACETFRMDGAGLQTFPLKNEVTVAAGTWYAIVVENVGSKTESYSAQRLQEINDVLFETDNLYCRSLTRGADGAWTDLAENGEGEVLRIRAATRTLKTTVAGRKVFSDVLDVNHPYYSAIYWAADNNITSGYKDGTFGTDRSCTRGEAIRFLWNFAGKPEPAKTSLKFSDVSTSDPFYKAILWAYQQGITKGYSDGTFGRDVTCTRGHIMMFLWKYMGKPSPRTTSSSPFRDVSPKHAYYKAILWGSQNGVTKGYKDGTFGINLNCTRGHIIKFLYNLR